MQRREDFDYDYYAGTSWNCRRDEQCRDRRKWPPFEVRDYSGGYGWTESERNRRGNRCTWKDSEIRKDMEQFEQLYPELARSILEEIRQVCGSVEGNGCAAYEGQPDRNTLEMLADQVMDRMRMGMTGYPVRERQRNIEQYGIINGEQGNRLNTGRNEDLGGEVNEEEGGMIIRELDEEPGYGRINDNQAKNTAGEWAESNRESSNREDGDTEDNHMEHSDMVWRNLVEVLICQELARRRARRRMAAQSRRF